MKFDGKPSFQLDHRPFFSIVVACYNSRKTLPRLLDSIVNQDMRDDLEVILSDDHSTESYDDIVDQYKDLICIKRVQTDYNCCPGNTREKGISVVEGEWLMIADHDDMLIDDVLLDVKYTIEKVKPKYYVRTNFKECYDLPGGHEKASNLIRNVNTPSGWNHGKFYNMDNLWRKFDVHFVKDMKSHEDIYISSVMNSIMAELGAEPYHLSMYTYVWYKRPESVSNSVYLHNDEPHPFLEVHFLDYLRSTSGVYKEMFLLGKLTNSKFIVRVLHELLLYEYFYLQSFYFHLGPKMIMENIGYCRKELKDFKSLTKFTNIDIFKMAAANDAEIYKAVEASADVATGPYIPKYTFLGWLDFLSEESVS